MTSTAASGDSMFRNAYALMLSTGVSAALGLGFWLVAARYYTEQAVGEGSAAIAAMRLLASLTATTMIGAVVRYVPRAGRATGPLVWRAYALSSLVVCLASVAFLFTLDLWGPSYAPLGGLGAGLIFTASCVGWALLTLQDGVLTGLRKAVWVPVGNAAFSIGKLLLLAVFATALPVLGIFVSWAAAIAVSVLPLGWLIFRRLIPRQAAADHDREPLRIREIGRFLAGDSVGSLFSLAMINLLPVMVAVRFDAAHNGFFYIAYTVGGTMEFMAINMASSLTAHASHSPETLAAGVRGALRRMSVLLVPVVLFLVVFAPQILAPFGDDYAAHGTTVLRLLAAAALPRVVVELYIGVLRVQGRTGMLAALQGTMCALVLGSAALLLGPTGISGAGLAMLLSMSLTALVAAPGLRAALSGREPRQAWFTRLVRHRGAEVEEEYGTTWARRAAERRAEAAAEYAREYGTDWARQTAYLRGVHEDTATPAFGFPVYVQERTGQEGPGPKGTGQEGPGPEGSGDDRSGRERTADGEAGRPSVDPGEGRLATALWLLLGLAAGLFWIPLFQAPDIAPGPTMEQLSGSQLLRALPPVTLTAGVLLIVVHSAAVSLLRPRPVLLGAGLLVTFAALHTAPAVLGWEPEPVRGAWYESLASFLAVAAGLDSPDPLLRWLPTVFQLLCLVALLPILGATRLPVAAQWGALWLLAVCGWALQKHLAPAALPLQLGLSCAALTLVLIRHRSHTRSHKHSRSRSRSRE
ncbi:lipopolysaccharide biosynthesis protein [Streptomyces sp. NBC_01142]|uniref:lipopolysaccharide biosynthesis protein n=1 Tax=Streptomyces sp. NBC_01142 TaxID=2975865 RepID=UPI00224F36DC|nr:lipopolysaccharide biosynthesis protein [Streptomyces sp. NBC_01142]MCX4823578.1 lipopolysaccharide biosynthesis protein [Streptomyces sp. NBC_01142]